MKKSPHCKKHPSVKKVWYDSQGGFKCPECSREANQRRRKLHPTECADNSRRWRDANPEHVRKLQKNWLDKNQDKLLEYSVKEYGLTAAEYRVKLENQKGVCAICKQPERVKRSTTSSQTKRLSVDHRKSTGKVRDLLCCRCNHVLGLVDENTALLKVMVLYLMKHNNG